MKKSKALIKVESLLEQTVIKDPLLKTEIVKLKELILKDEARIAFKLERTHKDKEIAVNLLDQAIKDLSENVRHLQIVNEEMQHFMHVASHDLKTPLRSIGSFANLIQRRYGDEIPEGAKDYFSFIQKNATAMNGVIDDLVAFNGAGVTVQDEKFHLEELVKEVIQYLYADIEASQATVEYSHLGLIEAPRSSIGQLLQNMIRNAIVYRDLNRPCHIHISQHLEDGKLTLAIRDNGVGLSENFREKAFLPFKRVGDLEREGTGMGLAICRRIARRVGGDIDYRGEVGIGTTFYIGLASKPYMDFALPNLAQLS